MASPDLDDPNLPLARIFAAWPETASVFLAHRMLCVGCPIAPFHTIADACAEYRLAEAPFRAELLRVTRAAGAMARESRTISDPDIAPKR